MGSSRAQKLPRRSRMLVTPNALLPLLLLALPAVADEGILDCFTGPCVTVAGVGKLQGTWQNTQWTDRRVFQFMGIPFGETTGGEHRFGPPRRKGPLNDGKDAFDASYFNYITDWWDHVCPQAGISLGGEFVNPLLVQAAQDPELNATMRGLPGAVIGTEDCLHLAVHTPELPSGDHNPKLPVMVYIHGGSFTLGGYIGAGPRKLLERDMVLVSLQYGVGPLGFLCLPDDQIAGNVGLMDQLLALQWVQDHIAAFGGDPARVTIMGESAGSASVTYHMLSPLSQPYYEQAIAESGSALSSWAFDSEPEKHAKDIVGGFMDCPTESVEEMVNCIKYEKTAADIVVAHKKYSAAGREAARMGFGGSCPCAQRYGHQKFITKHPKQYLMDAINNGWSTSPKKSIFGANKHEGSFVLGMIYNSYILPNGVVEDAHFLRHLFSATLLEALGLKDDSGVIYELINYRYFMDHMLGDWDLMIDGMINLVGTFFIKASTYEFMKFNQIAGAENYFYSFEYRGNASLWNFLFPGQQPPIPRGVTHGDELLYLFSTGVFNFSDEDWEVARIMSNLWANFVIYGNPTAPEFPVEGVPDWPLWQDRDKRYLTITSSPVVNQEYLMTWETPDIFDKP